MERKLTDQEITKLSLGYNWNQEMSYEDFIRSNKKLSREQAFEIYSMINDRYIFHQYENQ